MPLNITRMQGEAERSGLRRAAATAGITQPSLAGTGMRAMSKAERPSLVRAIRGNTARWQKEINAQKAEEEARSRQLDLQEAGQAEQIRQFNETQARLAKIEERLGAAQEFNQQFEVSRYQEDANRWRYDKQRELEKEGYNRDQVAREVARQESQFREQLKLNQAKLAEDQRQFGEQMQLNKFALGQKTRSAELDRQMKAELAQLQSDLRVSKSAQDSIQRITTTLASLEKYAEKEGLELADIPSYAELVRQREALLGAAPQAQQGFQAPLPPVRRR